MVSQSYTVNLWEENVLRGNAAILKCHIPSFVTEYVTVTSWIISEGDRDEMEINLDSDFTLGNVYHSFLGIFHFLFRYPFIPVLINLQFIIIGCPIKPPRIQVIIYVIYLIYVFETISVVSQAYDVKFWEEYVLRGNAAILKCQIPSYVSEYVSVSSWIISEDENEQEIRINSTSDLGINLIIAN